eukprot:m.199552 g.199552  ORF g.199552 m.199552 type:complete len:294 (+) comp25918_c0_seq5:549-1430(+)
MTSIENRKGLFTHNNNEHSSSNNNNTITANALSKKSRNKINNNSSRGKPLVVVSLSATRTTTVISELRGLGSCRVLTSEHQQDCDFIVSKRTAIERLTQQEVSSCSHKESRKRTRLQLLARGYDRGFVIVEKDRNRELERAQSKLPTNKKVGKVTNDDLQKTANFRDPYSCKKGYESALVAIADLENVTLLYSENAKQTAQLVAQVALHEQARGHEINPRWPLKLSGHSREVMNVLMSIPLMTFVAARALIHSAQFPTLADLFGCTDWDSVRSLANMTSQKVAALQTYIQSPL